MKCHIVIDLEATCQAEGNSLESMEIIEIGAVKLNEGFTIIDEFDSFVRPEINPVLTNFCKNLTHISQEDIAEAESFHKVFSFFINWICDPNPVVITWGAYDIKHLELECKRHGLQLPQYFTENHINLKKVFAKHHKIKRCGMKTALQIAGIPLEGQLHRGIDDAKNIAKIAQLLLMKKSS